MEDSNLGPRFVLGAHPDELGPPLGSNFLALGRLEVRRVAVLQSFEVVRHQSGPKLLPLVVFNELLQVRRVLQFPRFEIVSGFGEKSVDPEEPGLFDGVFVTGRDGEKSAPQVAAENSDFFDSHVFGSVDRRHRDEVCKDEDEDNSAEDGDARNAVQWSNLDAKFNLDRSATFETNEESKDETFADDLFVWKRTKAGLPNDFRVELSFCLRFKN